MNYNKILHKDNPNFKGMNNNEWKIFGIDEAGQPIRNHIREHYNRWHNPTIDIYEKEQKLEEYPLKQKIKQLLNHNQLELQHDENKIFLSSSVNKIDDNIMEFLPLCNVSKLKNRESYRGQTLAETSEDVLKDVKKAGIKTVIDLVGYFNQKEKINNAGLEYVSLDMEQLYDYMSPYSYSKYTKKEEQTIKKQFISFINKMQEDNVYIGCEYGTYKTDDALYLNKLFNPKMQREYVKPSVLNMTCIANFYDKLNLTKEDKKALKWTKEFEQSFLENLKKIGR